MNEPLVSVIITTHKGTESILRCVQSVLSQDYKNIEIIIVDDNGLGSDEQKRTRSVIADLIKNGKVLYYAHETNKNGSAARNTGFSMSKGELIGFIDDDDEYMSGKISKSVEILNGLDMSWGGCYTDAIVNKGEHAKHRTHSNAEGYVLFQNLCHLIFMNPSTLILRREVVERIGGYDDSFLRHQDFEFNARLASICKLKHINFVGSIYNCQTHRHFDEGRAIEYRNYYMEKMRPLIEQLPFFKQRVVATRNAVEVLGVKIIRYGDCKKLCKKWGYKMNFLSYVYTLAMTYKERKKERKLKSIKVKIREKLNPYFGPIRQKRLCLTMGTQVQPFTIISNDCWGGHVYRYYNLPYSSPTVGLFFFSEDFVKFAYDVKGYVSLKFNFITYRESKYRRQLEEYGGECLECPIGVLGDIEVIFLHYKTIEEALEKWNRRKDRINWDNMLFKMSEMNLCNPALLRKFDQLPTPRKVLFTTRDYNLNSQIIFRESYMKDCISDDTTNFRKYINLDAFVAGRL